MLERVSKLIKEGYDSIDLGMKKIIWDRMVYIHKEKPYMFTEYAFSFPYYLVDEDFVRIGKAMKLLEIQATYGQEKLPPVLLFFGRVTSIDRLLEFVYGAGKSVKSLDCELFVVREPLMIKLEYSPIGSLSVYERFLTIQRRTKQGE